MGIEKHIKVTGNSTVSWKDAIIKTVQDISENTNFVTAVRILDQRAKVTVDKITEYYVDLEITYLIDSDK